MKDAALAAFSTSSLLVNVCSIVVRKSASISLFEHIRCVGQVTMMQFVGVLLSQTAMTMIVMEARLTADLIDVWRHKFLRSIRLSSLLLGEHACQVENRLATEPDTVGVLNYLALVILRSK